MDQLLCACSRFKHCKDDTLLLAMEFRLQLNDPLVWCYLPAEMLQLLSDRVFCYLRYYFFQWDWDVVPAHFIDRLPEGVLLHKLLLVHLRALEFLVLFVRLDVGERYCLFCDVLGCWQGVNWNIEECLAPCAFDSVGWGEHVWGKEERFNRRLVFLAAAL